MSRGAPVKRLDFTENKLSNAIMQSWAWRR
jgi:hypothetical protein